MQFTVSSRKLLNSPAEEPTDQAEAQRLDLRVFITLSCLSVVGAAGLLPTVFTQLQNVPVPFPAWVLALIQSAQVLVLSVAATALGLRLGPRFGLGAPLLAELVRKKASAWSRAQRTMLFGLAVGVPTTATVLALEFGVFAKALSQNYSSETPSPWKGLLASFYGAINEELMIRLGLLTFLIWLMVKIFRRQSPAWVWASILISAAIFGLGHLPATAAMLPLTPMLILRAIVLNGIAGIAFGWLYWKRGLLSAMAAHFGADLLIRVLMPIFCLNIASLPCSPESMRDVRNQFAPLEAKVANLINGYNLGDYSTFSLDFDDGMRVKLNQSFFDREIRGRTFAIIGKHQSDELVSVTRPQGRVLLMYRARFEKDSPVMIRVFFESQGDQRVSGLFFASPKLFEATSTSRTS